MTHTEIDPTPADVTWAEQSKRMTGSMSLHRVTAVTTETDRFDRDGADDIHTTRVTFRDSRGGEFTITAFSDQPVAIEDVTGQ